MRGVLIILLLVVVQLAQCKTRKQEQELGRERSHFYYYDGQSCVQDKPDCERCLSSSGNCEWCSDGEQCIEQGSETCPHGNRQTACDSQTAEDERQETLQEYYDKSLDELKAMDASAVNNSVQNTSMVTVNASVLCGRQGGCDNCTANEFCFWCESKQECQVHFNETTREQSCPKTNTAYHSQCIYPIGVTPCNKRKSTCKDCLGDGLCYWCKSTEACEFYPGGEFQPNDCPRDKWDHEDCYFMKGLFWVLLPMLAIILIPVIIYVILWLICCCMRAAGYEPLQPVQPATKKHPKGIRLKPGTPSNKTDELRKKYDLNNP